MANSYETATVTPFLPVKGVSQFARDYLSLFGFSCEGKDELYLYAEEGVYYETVDWMGQGLTVGDATRASFASPPCPVAQAVWDALPDDAEMGQSVTEFQNLPTWPEVFQLLLEPCGLDEIVVEAAMWCDKARQGEFGGWVTRITKDRIQSGGTSQLIGDWRKEDA